MRNAVVLTTCAALTLAACAEKAANITPSYVPATRFMAMDCAELYAETEAVAANLNATSTAQDKKANADALLVGAGLILFWPALFMTSGTLGKDGNEGQIATLKGEAEGLRTAYQAKHCRPG